MSEPMKIWERILLHADEWGIPDDVLDYLQCVGRELILTDTPEGKALGFTGRGKGGSRPTYRRAYDNNWLIAQVDIRREEGVTDDAIFEELAGKYFMTQESFKNKYLEARKLASK